MVYQYNGRRFILYYIICNRNINHNYIILLSSPVISLFFGLMGMTFIGTLNMTAVGILETKDEINELMGRNSIRMGIN
jgi:hypothetical protein